MEYRDISIEWLGHDTFRIKAKGKTIYIDPFELSTGEKADLALVTHEHYDHCSCKDLEKITSEKTSLVCNSQAASKITSRAVCDRITKIESGQKLELSGIIVRAVPAYNLKKPFHPRGSGIGYLIQIGGVTIYHAGDTDFIPEMNSLKGKITIALLPVSGTYVMTAEEAVKAAEAIQPEIAIPMHYGSVVGSGDDAKRFAALYKGKTMILERSV